MLVVLAAAALPPALAAVGAGLVAVGVALAPLALLRRGSVGGKEVVCISYV